MKKTNRMLGEILGLLRGKNIAVFYAQRYTWIDNFDAQIEDNQENTGSAELEDPKGKLLKLSQTGSVIEYQAAFEDIRSHVTEVPEAVLISLYILGSELAIHEGLHLNRPTTLTKAFELARKFEKNYQDNKTEVQGRFQEHCDMVASAVHGHLILRDLQGTSTRIGVELNSLIMIEVGPKFVGVSQYHNIQLAHITQLLMCSLSKGHELHQMQDKWPISQEDAMVTLLQNEHVMPLLERCFS